MGIADEDVATVRESSDIVAVVSHYVQLRRVGRRWTGLCPFHSEKTPSFSVNGEENLYYCFGCQASGDVITFVREVEKLDFVGAIEWLASKMGLTLRYTDHNEGESRKRRARLVEVMSRAADWYHERLLTSPDAGAARRYLRSRGLDGDVVREYRLGWAPDAWDELCRSLKLGEEVARETGLGFRNSRNRLQDTFRARVMFPIADPQGNPVSFGGRLLPDADDPKNRGKYKNTPETPLYHKSKVLYGMDHAKKAMVSEDKAVICEGYTDVIGFRRSGVGAAVATCGTALTDEHVKLLTRYTSHLVLAFDADGAGQAAAERFYLWEKEHRLKVTVADLPVGMDPADVARDSPERLAAAVEQPKPFMRFRLDRVFADSDLGDPEGRARVVEQALALVAEHPDELTRDQYLMDVAGRCRMDAERLRPRLDGLRRDHVRGAARQPGPPRRGERPPHPAAETPPVGSEEIPPHPADVAAGRTGRSVGGSTPATTRGRRDGPDWEVLRHAVHNPASVASWLREEAFDDPRHQQVLRSLVMADTIPAAVDHAVASGDDAAGDLLRRLAMEEPESEPFDAVCLFLRELARRELHNLRYAAAGREGSTEALTDSAFLSGCIDALRSTDTARRAADGLLAWLDRRVGDGG